MTASNAACWLLLRIQQKALIQPESLPFLFPTLVLSRSGYERLFSGLFQTNQEKFQIIMPET
jgi:hypothetical protein